MGIALHGTNRRVHRPLGPRQCRQVIALRTRASSDDASLKQKCVADCAFPPFWSHSTACPAAGEAVDMSGNKSHHRDKENTRSSSDDNRQPSRRTSLRYSDTRDKEPDSSSGGAADWHQHYNSSTFSVDSCDTSVGSNGSTSVWHPTLRTDGTLGVHVDLDGVNMPEDWFEDIQPPDATTADQAETDILATECPPLNIVMFAVGSKGDVEPFVALALQLILSHGHTVRIATHPHFKDLINRASEHLVGQKDHQGRRIHRNLEHFDIGGEPHQVMAYLVKFPNLLPNAKSILAGDVKSKRRVVSHMLMRCYRACFCPSDSTGQPFGADAIISNPPAMAHVHVAEALGIPLIIFSTVPWTPTAAFGNPFVSPSVAQPGQRLTNFASFAVANGLLWEGLEESINLFRVHVLDLPPLNSTTGPLVLETLNIPVVYGWAEALLPKPKDWRGNIDIVGFIQMPQNTPYLPDPSLVEFIAAGDRPVYIGFGEVVIPDPNKLLKTILEAVKLARVRAIVSVPPADLEGPPIPNSVFILKSKVPHSWLFNQVVAVCHHGGAGTTGAVLRAGLPAVVVPFFGDQLFWGTRVNELGAGPKPIPYADLNPADLASGLRYALSPSVCSAAAALGGAILGGGKDVVARIHAHLPMKRMQCQVDPTSAARWVLHDDSRIQVGNVAAAVLVEENVYGWHQFMLSRPLSYLHRADRTATLAASILRGPKAIWADFLYLPYRSLGQLAVVIPQAGLEAVTAVQETVGRLPAALGSGVRRRKQVHSLREGLAEGIKGLGYGIYDGVAGLVMEPRRGAQCNGVDGFVNGAGKALINLATRPVGGVLGLTVHPINGAFRGVRQRLAPTGIIEGRAVLRDPREKTGHAEACALSGKERKRIVVKFHSMCLLPKVKGVGNEGAGKDGVGPLEINVLPERSTRSAVKTSGIGYSMPGQWDAAAEDSASGWEFLDMDRAGQDEDNYQQNEHALEEDIGAAHSDPSVRTVRAVTEQTDLHIEMTTRSPSPSPISPPSYETATGGHRAPSPRSLDMSSASHVTQYSDPFDELYDDYSEHEGCEARPNSFASNGTHESTHLATHLADPASHVPIPSADSTTDLALAGTERWSRVSRRPRSYASSISNYSTTTDTESNSGSQSGTSEAGGEGRLWIATAPPGPRELGIIVPGGQGGGDSDIDEQATPIATHPPEGRWTTAHDTRLPGRLQNDTPAPDAAGREYAALVREATTTIPAPIISGPIPATSRIPILSITIPKTQPVGLVSRQQPSRAAPPSVSGSSTNPSTPVREGKGRRRSSAKMFYTDPDGVEDGEGNPPSNEVNGLHHWYEKERGANGASGNGEQERGRSRSAKRIDKGKGKAV